MDDMELEADTITGSLLAEEIIKTIQRYKKDFNVGNNVIREVLKILLEKTTNIMIKENHDHPKPNRTTIQDK